LRDWAGKTDTFGREAEREGGRERERERVKAGVGEAIELAHFNLFHLRDWGGGKTDTFGREAEREGERESESRSRRSDRARSFQLVSLERLGGKDRHVWQGGREGGSERE
jgi:hypothetical protein